MKELLINTAKRTGLASVDLLTEYFQEKEGDRQRIDELLLTAPNFTEETVLKLFAQAMGIEFLSEIASSDVPMEFVESVPATYAQHHYVIGFKKTDDPEIIVVLSKPLDTSALSRGVHD